MSTPASNRPFSPARQTNRFGLPVAWIIGLALLGLPRVVLHDLGVISEGTAVNAVLVVLPPVAWIVVALVKRVPHPFLMLLTVGAVYGLVLAVAHQLLWSVAFDDAPRLGGNLTDLAPEMQELIIRFFAMTSSLFTGLVVGAIVGVIAWAISAVVRRHP